MGGFVNIMCEYNEDKIAEDQLLAPLTRFPSDYNNNYS